MVGRDIWGASLSMISPLTYMYYFPSLMLGELFSITLALGVDVERCHV